MTEQHHPTSDDMKRDPVLAKIERGLADVEAGRVIPHAEVLARIQARYGELTITGRSE